MAETLLQTYLNNQFIKTTEEGNLTNLKKAIAELEKQLQKKRLKIIAYTLVAMDPHISENDPVVVEVEKIIIKKWPAFKNNVTATKDKATTYIRAVILEALTKLAKDAEFATLIWLSSRNLIQHYKLHKEENVISSLLQSFFVEKERTAHSIWGLSNEIEIPTFSIPEISIESKIASKDFLTKRLHAATGPSSMRDGVNEANEEANRYWPSNNHTWSGDFGDIAGEAIASSMNNVLRGQNKTLSRIKDQINTSLQGLEPFFKQIGLTFLQSANNSNKRSQLLWWKETLYSSSVCKSYRSMDPINSAITMAVDLSSMVDPVYPQSVDFLLKESLKSAQGDQVDVEGTLAELLDEALKMEDQEKSLLQSLISNQEGRKPLGTALANKLSGDSSNLFIEIGIEKDVKVTLADFSVWIFHDLQSQKIASTK